MKFSFTVPGPPVPKGRPRFFVRNGRVMVYTPKETEAYEKRVWAYAKTGGFKGRAWAGPLIARITLYFTTLKTKKGAWKNVGDWDNCGKIISDALNEFLYEDDVQIVEAHVYKRVDAERPRVEVEIEEQPAETLAQLEIALGGKS